MRISLFVACSLLALGCATTPKKPALDYAALVAAEDRTSVDRELDPGRKPAAFLASLEVGPGMQVGELFAGGGYTTELLARAVGPSGKVYAENPKWVLERFAGAPWAERLTRPVNANVVRLDRELDDPFGAELNEKLDLVVINANYHDALWTNVNVSKMNRAVFAALKPGGRYVVCDSSAKPGAGPEVAEQLHRIDEAIVRKQLEVAGFAYVRSDESLRNPNDTRDWNASPREAAEKRGSSDRFIVVYTKP
ncbi:MAG: class I SAM-dependent methyltransferase [Archangium sp.]|nr:class I SAM-dependent methyltransferase [Archangium sp.]